MKQSYEELGKNIAYYRRRAGLTQDMLSMQMGVSMQAVSKWERSISSPDVSLLPPLAQALGVTIDALHPSDRGISRKEIRCFAKNLVSD